MNLVNIFMADGTINGPVIISSTASKFSAIRLSRNDAKSYNELDEPGIYFLLVGNDSIYVGQTGLDTVGKRIFKPHTGIIDTSWHTVIGFVTSDKTIDNNQLLYLENAMCEYVHAHYSACLTTSPSKVNCNKGYRSSHYHLNASKILSCNAYVKDMEQYLTYFGKSVFPSSQTGTKVSSQPSLAIANNATIPVFLKKDSGVDATGEFDMQQNSLLIHKGSIVSNTISAKFAASNVTPYRLRKQYEADGTIQNRSFTKDVQQSSPSYAAAIILGRSADGKLEWKNKDGIHIGSLHK